MADISIAVVLLDTHPYHAMTLQIALSQFSEGDQTNNISQELSEKLHKLGPCQKLLKTKSDLAKITTWDGVRVHHKKKQWGESSP